MRSRPCSSEQTSATPPDGGWMTDRLPSHVEAASIIRRVQSEGGFAAVLRKGDPDRGALTLIVRERGELRGFLERELGADFNYSWSFKRLDAPAEGDSVADLVARKERFDPDSWLIELDVAEPERFIAETTRLG
jgi:hypothetical protein